MEPLIAELQVERFGPRTPPRPQPPCDPDTEDARARRRRVLEEIPADELPGEAS